MSTNTDVSRRLELIMRNVEETLTTADLEKLLARGEQIQHYIGFEISGKIHLGSGLMCMSKIRDFMDAGVDCSIFLADWHTWINDKLGGDRDTIRQVAVNYFKEGMKASLLCLGRDPEKLKFVLGSELYEQPNDFWATVIDVSKNTSLARMQRSITILGRKEGDAVDFAKLIYPAMQVADIFTMQVNLAQSGMDQRKAHVIARDTALHMRINPLRDSDGRQIKPVAIHHHLLLGLRKPPTWPPPGREPAGILGIDENEQVGPIERDLYPRQRRRDTYQNSQGVLPAGRGGVQPGARLGEAPGVQRAWHRHARGPHRRERRTGEL